MSMSTEDLSALEAAASKAEAKASEARAKIEAKQRGDFERRDQREQDWARRIVDNYDPEATSAVATEAYKRFKTAVFDGDADAIFQRWIDYRAAVAARWDLATEAQGAAQRIGDNRRVHTPNGGVEDFANALKTELQSAASARASDAALEREEQRERFIEGSSDDDQAA